MIKEAEEVETGGSVRHPPKILLILFSADY